MTPDDIMVQKYRIIIQHIFFFVDDNLPNLPRDSRAKLYPRELVAIGILFALKGGFFRAFYRWLKRDYGNWFANGTLPERTRLQRLLKTHQDGCDLLMADPTFRTVMDSYAIELIFPIRTGVAVRNKWAKRVVTRAAGTSASSFVGFGMTFAVLSLGIGQP